MPGWSPRGRAGLLACPHTSWGLGGANLRQRRSGIPSQLDMVLAVGRCLWVSRGWDRPVAGTLPLLRPAVLPAWCMEPCSRLLGNSTGWFWLAFSLGFPPSPFLLLTGVPASASQQVFTRYQFSVCQDLCQGLREPTGAGTWFSPSGTSPWAGETEMHTWKRVLVPGAEC